MSGRPLHRLPVEERRAIVEQYVGRKVTAFYDAHRDGSRIVAYHGELVAVAYPTAGTVSDQAVVVLDPGLTVDGRRAVSISLSSLDGLIVLGLAEVGRIPESELR